MSFFDWLFGKSNVGVLKTLLLSGLLGFGLAGTLIASMGGGTYIYDGAGGQKFLIAALGYPVLAGARAIYWHFRRRQLWRGILRHKDRAWDDVFGLYKWRPSLEREFAWVIDAELLRIGASERYGTGGRPPVGWVPPSFLGF